MQEIATPTILERTAVKPSIAPPQPLSNLELEVIELFVHLAQTLSMPKSIGEIYGLLYLASDPMPMDQIIARLQISTGSASQGLRLLKSFGAVNSSYIPGERRDHFVAEREMRKLCAGFINDRLMPRLKSGQERISRMRKLLDEARPEERKAFEKQIHSLEAWHGMAKNILPGLKFFLGNVPG